MLSNEAFVEKVCCELRQHNGDGDVCIYCADFMNFKLVNYNYGIERGTKLLNSVVEYVHNIPEVVCCERIFSDQFVFVVVMPAKRTDAQILSSYERFAKAFLSEMSDQYPACNLKFCCGIARVADENISEAIDLANMARMEAKKTGAKTAILFTEEKIKMLAERQEREKEIMRALAEKRFIFYLQPKVNVNTGRIVGAEALARRMDEDGRTISPDNFIPILEENGSIIDLDFLIYELVCKNLQSRIKEGLQCVPVSVNLSRLHTWNLRTASRIHQIAQKYKIPPKLLEFELTEGVILNEFKNAKQLMNKLRGYGYSVSIDDYGSGYNSIKILRELDFDVLKLDRSFLSDDMEIKRRNTAIIEAIEQISEKLDFYLICEGAERADQCQFLKELGCQYIQGYYFSKPVPLEEFYNIYKQNQGTFPIPFNGTI